MPSTPVICFEQVSKRFEYTPDQPQTILESLIARLRRRGRRARHELWALRDVSFEVQSGQSIGFIGRNGSGKSTLLKLASRIIRPTSGVVTVNGRISALLELGAGFHPDLTGRENIFLNGSVLGLSRREVEARFNAIVDFSELATFIDMPVKHYSSGMYMRLGFSVAVHCDPDVLLVDEILAVGDQAFQEKCLDRIYDLKHRGVTVVMVSHQLPTLQGLCTDLIWMEHGGVREIGLADTIIGHYLEHMRQIAQPGAISGAQAFNRWGTGDIEITGVRFLDARGELQDKFRTGEALTIEIAFVAHRPILNPEFGLAIYRDDGVHINGPNNRLAGREMGLVSGCGVVRYIVPHLPLLPAAYIVTAAIHDSRQSLAYDFHERAYHFRVVAGGVREQYGLLALPAAWEWEVADSSPEMGAPMTAAPQNELKGA